MKTRTLLTGLLKIEILNALAYRIDFVMLFVSGISLITIQYYLWKTVFDARTTVATYSFIDTISYMALVWSLHGLLSTQRISRTISDKLINGSITVDLLYPRHYMKLQVMQGYAMNLMQLLLAGVPVFIVSVVLFHIHLPDPMHAALFVVSIHCSFGIAAVISFLIGICSVYLKNIEGLLQLERFTRSIFAGAMIPLAFFPDFIGVIAHYLPFQGIISIPLNIYLGREPLAQSLNMIVVQMIWLAALTIAGLVALHRARRRLEVFGG